MVKVTLKYTLLGRLCSICQVPWRTVACRQSYKQGNFPKDEIKDDATSQVLVRLWSKWCWNIHYWVDSEVYAKYHDDRMSVDGVTSRGIPSDAKFHLQTLKHNCLLPGQFLHVSGQTEFQIYIIWSPLKYVPSTMTNGWLPRELQAGKFPQGRN